MQVNRVMPRVLTKLQIEQYHDEGFISPIRVISEQEALSIKDELEQVEKEFPEEINSELAERIFDNVGNIDYIYTVIQECVDEVVEEQVMNNQPELV